MSLRNLSVCIAALLAIAIPDQSNAEPRALIIGVGKYQLPNSDLPGIDIDVNNMRDIAQLMGFKPEHVRVLLDEEATHARVTKEMSTWLRTGVKTEDPVLIYFSGHGTRVADLDGDESDKADETLVLHDSRWGPKAQLERSLVDDQLAELVSKIPSERVLIFVDACNSGTSTRNIAFPGFALGGSGGVSKFLYYPQMPKGKGNAIKDEAKAGKNFAALAAAGDEESAIATDQGGVFTLGLVQAIKEAAKSKHDISVLELRSEVAAFIDKRLAPSLRFNPVTTGRAELIDGDLNLLPLENGNGPTWRDLEALAGRGDKLTLSSSKQRYRVGEEVELTIESERGGYLNVVTVDSKDGATVLFPNKYRSDNKISAGRFVFPTVDMPFTLPAAEPLGKTLIVAFLSDKPVNAIEMGIEGRDAAGRLSATFTEPTQVFVRAVQVAARSAGFSAGAVELTVEAAAQ
jgi:metacaspase-1